MREAVKVPLNQRQFDALVSIFYNAGVDALAASTLVRVPNLGDYAGAAAQFARWNKSGGEVMKGLQRRREAEGLVFLGTGGLRCNCVERGEVPMIGLPDLKTPLLWALGLPLVAALGVAAIERTRAAGARAGLATEQRDRAKENTARALTALVDLQRVVALVASHAKTEQENVDGYEAPLEVLASRGRTVAAELGRVRKQYADFVARDRD